MLGTQIKNLRNTIEKFCGYYDQQDQVGFHVPPLAIGAVQHIREVGWTIMTLVKYCTVVKLLSQSSVVALRGGIDLTEQHSKSADFITITAKSHT